MHRRTRSATGSARGGDSAGRIARLGPKGGSPRPPPDNLVQDIVETSEREGTRQSEEIARHARARSFMFEHVYLAPHAAANMSGHTDDPEDFNPWPIGAMTR